MDNNDNRQLIDNLKDKLLCEIYDTQLRYRSASPRHSKMASDQKNKFLDALARVFCFTTDSVCSAVYLDDNKQEVLLSSNNNKMSQNYIQKAWNKIIDNQVESTEYVEYYRCNASYQSSYAHSINGYLSVKNWHALLIQLERFQNIIAHTKLQNKDTSLGKLQVAFIPLQKSIKEFIYEQVCEELYTKIIKQAHECASIFKEWKRGYQAADQTQGPSSSKAYKSIFQYLGKDKELEGIIGEIKPLRSLIYSLRKFDSDLQKVKDGIDREHLKSYTVISPHCDKWCHAEIKIIDYLQNHDYFNECTYKIGISKLACAMCYEIIKAHEQQNNIKIHIKGYHGKVYYKWNYLPEGNLKIYKAALTEIAKQYQIGFLLQCKMLKEEASTNTSMSTYSDDAEQRDDEHNAELNSDQTQDTPQHKTTILDLVDNRVIEQHVRILIELLKLHMNDKFGHNKTDIEVFDHKRFYWIENYQFYPSDIAQHADDHELTTLLGQYDSASALEEDNWD